MTARRSGKRLVRLLVGILMTLPVGVAEAASELHVTGTGAVAANGCATALNIHATGLGHPGQYLDLWTTCTGAMSEVHAQGAPDCGVQIGTVAYLSYNEEQVRLVISDGGLGTDQVAVEFGAFKKATPANKCLAKNLQLAPAAGDFMVGLP